MTGRGAKGKAAGFEDVVAGEEGGPPMSPTGGDAQAYDASQDDSGIADSDAGSTSGIQNLQLEVDILSAAAVDKVAQEIAKRAAVAARKSGLAGVVVASPQAIAFLRLHAALEAEISSLEAAVEQLASASSEPAAIEIADAAGFAPFPIIAAAVSSAPRMVGTASAMLKKIAATTAYSGRSGRTRQVLLDAALAKHLALQKLDVSVPERALPSEDSRGLIPRILKLQNRAQQLQVSDQSGGDYSRITASLDALIAALFGGADDRAVQAPLAQQLMLADGVARCLASDKAVLFAEIAFSGGSYRTRKWIFNFLLGRDGLTYSGGAGVTYFLFRAEDRTTLDSDTVYFALPHGNFRHARRGEFSPTNING